MKSYKLFIGMFFILFASMALVAPQVALAKSSAEVQQQDTGSAQTGEPRITTQHDTGNIEVSAEPGEVSADDHGAAPAWWSVLPFALLLIMIATGPLFYAHFWHKNYPLIAAFLGAVVVIYYLAVLHNTHQPIHSLAEYISFIALIASLFVASGGILIKVDKEGTPWANVALLLIGAVLANVIGTTGASMVLIRPFIRLNKDRIKPFHIVFFIFMVSNVGGALTPIGDPPLFLGFLKGVPFEWTLIHAFPAWVFGIGLLAIIFFFVDKSFLKNHPVETKDVAYSGKITILGKKNMLWLAVVIISVFMDPNVFDFIPAIVYDGQKFSFIREIIMLTTAVLAYKTSDKECLKGNEFDFEPIKEVAFLFVGIFATMMPALQLVSEFANSEDGSKLITVDSLYWFTGILSGVLDNAPTYLNFLAAGMGNSGLDINEKMEVLAFSQQFIDELLAISVAAVFFGAFTYIGNAPNFMVKAIAEQSGIRMPSFVAYVIRFSIPFLLPVLLLTWLLFFVIL